VFMVNEIDTLPPNILGPVLNKLIEVLDSMDDFTFIVGVRNYSILSSQLQSFDWVEIRRSEDLWMDYFGNPKPYTPLHQAILDCGGVYSFLADLYCFKIGTSYPTLIRLVAKNNWLCDLPFSVVCAALLESEGRRVSYEGLLSARLLANTEAKPLLIPYICPLVLRTYASRHINAMKEV
jgi:hypothetical protein